MRKVLIITYYWPPSGGGGVQRWLKFVKYLNQFGYEPIVYTPENPNAPANDPGLEKDIPSELTVLKQPIREPYHLYRIFTRRKKTDNPGAAFASDKQNTSIEKFANWIRSNFFIPDARVLWVNPSVKYLTKYIQKNPVELIVSTGPPHSMHLIGMKLRKKINIPWIADFRDPWTGIDYYDELLLSPLADKKHKKLEKQVLQTADRVITVSQANKEEFKAMGFDHISVITNGFDHDDLNTGPVKPNKAFSIAHIGTFMYNRNPDILWEALKQLKEENPGFAKDLVIKLIGKIDKRIIEQIKAFNLEKSLNQTEYLPHDQAILELKKSQVLLLVINKTGNNKGMLTGKVFEYISSGTPILCIGPEGSDVEKLLNDTQSGIFTDLTDISCLKKNILRFYDTFKKGVLVTQPKNIANYSRINLTKQLSVIFDSLIEPTTYDG